MLVPFKERNLDLTKKVRVHRNLNKQGVVYSISQNGHVVAHGNDFTIINAVPKVNKKGYEKYLETGVRNVHAFIEGDLLEGSLFGNIDGVLIYKDGRFESNTGSTEFNALYFSDTGSVGIYY